MSPVYYQFIILLAEWLRRLPEIVMMMINNIAVSTRKITLATLALPVKVTELKCLASPVSSGSPAIFRISLDISAISRELLTKFQQMRSR